MPVPDDFAGANRFHEQDLARMRGAGRHRRPRNDGDGDGDGADGDGAGPGSETTGPAEAGTRRTGLRAVWADRIRPGLLGRGRSARP
jgi:hypothetical protein